MIDMLKRHQIQVLREAGHPQSEVAALAGVSVGSVRRVERETGVTHLDIARERTERGVGRPSKAEPFRTFVAGLMTTEPALLSVEILRRTKLAGYAGGKSALYGLVHSLRPEPVSRPDGGVRAAVPRLGSDGTGFGRGGREPGVASERA